MSSVYFDPEVIDYTPLFTVHIGGGQIHRFIGFPRQRGSGGAFRLLRRLIPAILKSPITRQLATKAAGNLGNVMARHAPEFANSPVGQHVTTAASNVLRDIGEGRKVKESLKEHARGAVRGLTGFGPKKKRNQKKMSPKPIGFIYKPRRSTRITL